MAVTIAAGDIAALTSSGETAGRDVVRTSLGVVWAVIEDASGNLDFWYSTDNGSTWTEDTGGVLTGRESYGISIDGSNRLHLKTDAAGGGSPRRYHYGTLNAGHTAVTWTTTALSSGNAEGDCVGFVLSGSSIGIAAWFTNSVIDFDRFTNGAATGTDPPSISRAGVNRIGLDFHHTGDGLTVSGGTPHLYLAYGRSAGVYMRKATYAAGAWTWGAERTVTTAGSTTLQAVAFDGSRFLMGVTEGTTIKVYERDSGDTTTTTRTPPALAGTFGGNLSVAYDSYGDIHLFARDIADNDIYTVVFDRSGASWGSWTAFEVGTYEATSSLRGNRDSRIEVLVQDATNVSHSSVALNVAPTAATWVTAAGAKDRDETLLLDWDFQDPDEGDTQSAYALSRVVNAGSTEYYNAGGGTWSGTETKNTSATTSVTLAAAWATDGDDIDFKVKTWDAADVEGVYSAALNIDASVQVNPTITAPADAGTVTTNTVSMTWTVGEQTQYRARLYNSGQTVTHEDSGWKTSTTTTYDFAFILTDGASYKVGITTRNNEGLDSDEDVHSFTADFTPPAQPSGTATADGDHIDIAITNPTPTGSQPTVTGNDLFVRVAAGGVSDGYRPVGGVGIRIATGIADDGSFVDWAAGDGYSYEYLVRAHGDNGTSTDSTWFS